MEEEKKNNVFKKVAEKVKEGAKTVGNAILEAIVDNPILLVPIMSAVTACLGGGVKKVQERGKEREAACRVTGTLTGIDYKIKHPMTNEEHLEYERRLYNGESTGQALDEMGLLK